MKKIFREILNKLHNPDVDLLNMSINNCHAPGVFSLVVSGSEHGKLTRIFIADKKIKPFDVQLHTHRYPIKITVLKGNITNHRAIDSVNGGIKISKFNYRSPLNGGKGLFYDSDIFINSFDEKLPIGGVLTLSTEDYHTISCSKGSMWIVEEKGFITEESSVLGVPFVLDGLYTKPEMFQINDKVQIVVNELKKVYQTYSFLEND